MVNILEERENFLKKLLIVEDETDLLNLYKLYSQSIDAKVFLASNGLEACDQLKISGPVDLILSDIRMPKMNGLDFLEILRNHENKYLGPFVFVTAYMDISVEEVLEKGGTDLIYKPLTRKIFLATIDRYMAMNNFNTKNLRAS